MSHASKKIPESLLESTREKCDGLRRQIGTLRKGEQNKYLPMAFTEQGVAILSSVLHSAGIWLNMRETG